MKKQYSNLPTRVKAAFIDGLVLIGMMYGTTLIFELFETIPIYIRVIFAIFIFVLYEPIFVSQFGATIGHSKSNISVQNDDDIGKRISFPLALIRFILKATLGWISFLTITGNEKRKAIHDFAVNSVVVNDSD